MFLSSPFDWTTSPLLSQLTHCKLIFPSVGRCLSIFSPEKPVLYLQGRIKRIQGYRKLSQKFGNRTNKCGTSYKYNLKEETILLRKKLSSFLLPAKFLHFVGVNFRGRLKFSYFVVINFRGYEVFDIMKINLNIRNLHFC